MKKENIFVVVMAAIAIIVLTVAVCIGEAKSAELEKISRVEQVLDRTAKLSGYESLGVIDAYAVSKETGYVYNGPAVKEALFSRIGLEVPESYWVFTIEEFDGIALMKMVVYRDDDPRPLLQRDVEQVYLYGVL